MIRYDKWRFDDRRFGGLTTQSEKKKWGRFHQNKGDATRSMGDRPGGSNPAMGVTLQ